MYGPPRRDGGVGGAAHGDGGNHNVGRLGRDRRDGGLGAGIVVADEGGCELVGDGEVRADHPRLRDLPDVERVVADVVHPWVIAVPVPLQADNNRWSIVGSKFMD